VLYGGKPKGDRVVTGRDWKAWWNEVPAQMPDTDLYHHVGRTVGGRANGEKDIITTSEAIISALQLTGNEIVLDLCCGNGLLSKKLAAHCAKLIGIDYSASLISIARRLNDGNNIDYVVSDVVHIGPGVIGLTEVEAAYLASAFQYFDVTAASELLRRLRAIAAPNFRLFIEGIADKERIFDFYDTPERQEEYRKRTAEGTEHIQTWWSRRALAELARSEGFECAAIAQAPDRVCAHYRFDALLTMAQ
jgi:cyclopropane fatty-acyl-phospholipid synthase-like methyltransferase